jgi:hypothetical protein
MIFKKYLYELHVRLTTANRSFYLIYTNQLAIVIIRALALIIGITQKVY